MYSQLGKTLYHKKEYPPLGPTASTAVATTHIMLPSVKRFSNKMKLETGSMATKQGLS